MKQILLIGSLGQLGRYLVEALTSLDIELHVMNRLHMDLAQTHLIQGKLNEFEPDLIINASAYTAVDLAEKESELAYLINRDAPMEMAKYAYDKGIPFLHYSTDYVFSGKASTPYKEQDPTDPQGVYGASKLEGEHEVLDSGANAYIFRTAWVYSQQGKNFYNTMLNLAENRNELSIVNDQYGSPTYAGEIAKATVIIVEMLLRGDSFKKVSII